MLQLIIGLLVRHFLTTIGGALAAHGMALVDGVPQVHDLLTTISGIALAASGVALSVAQKVKTKSGSDYTSLNK